MARTSDSSREPFRKTVSPSSKHLISWSLFWGGLLAIGFYGALHNGLLTNRLLIRYCTTHPIEYAIIIMAFIGFAFVAVKYFELLGRLQLLRKGPLLPPKGPERVPVSVCGTYLDALDEAIQTRHRGQASNHADRLRAALGFLHAGGDPEMLDMELRYMSDDDANNADAEYGFVRTILWAVPMLGFLGTVVGITQALGNLDLNAINESSKALSVGLSVAFDTTALAIGLDLVLYFFQFLTYRKETATLREVDRMLENELRGRFEVDEERRTGHGSEITTVRRMLTRVVESLEALTRSQTDIWNQAIGTANERFATLSAESAELVKTSLSAAISEAVVTHAAGIAKREKRLGEEIREATVQIAETLRAETQQYNLALTARTQEYNTVLRTESQKFHDGLRSNAEALLTLETAISRQAAAAAAAIDASAQLAVLEDRLNANLAALAQVGNFEQTVNALAAAIHLLNAKHFNGASSGVSDGIARNIRVRSMREKSVRDDPGAGEPPEKTARDGREADPDKGHAA